MHVACNKNCTAVLQASERVAGVRMEKREKQTTSIGAKVFKGGAFLVFFRIYYALAADCGTRPPTAAKRRRSCVCHCNECILLSLPTRRLMRCVLPHRRAKHIRILFIFCMCDGENIVPWQTQCLLLFLLKLLLRLLFNCIFVDVLIYFLPSFARAAQFRLCALLCK